MNLWAEIQRDGDRMAVSIFTREHVGGGRPTDRPRILHRIARAGGASDTTEQGIRAALATLCIDVREASA